MEAARDLRMFVPTAIRAILHRLSSRIAEAAGAPVTQIVDLNPAIPDRILKGEAFDLALTNPPYVLSLIESGLADADSHRAFGRVPLAVACREGAEEPLHTDPLDIARLLENADSIAYTGAGTSGRIFLEAAARLGLKQSTLDRCRAMDGGVPVASVAAGKMALAVAPLTTVLSSPGVAPAAIFPEAFTAHIDMSLCLARGTAAGSGAVRDLLLSPALDAELQAAGIMRFSLDTAAVAPIA